MNAAGNDALAALLLAQQTERSRCCEVAAEAVRAGRADMAPGLIQSGVSVEQARAQLAALPPPEPTITVTLAHDMPSAAESFMRAGHVLPMESEPPAP